jgi:hypothetical protein
VVDRRSVRAAPLKCDIGGCASQGIKASRSLGRYREKFAFEEFGISSHVRVDVLQWLAWRGLPLCASLQ